MIVKLEKLGENHFLLFIPTEEDWLFKYPEYMELGIRITDEKEYVFEYEKIAVYFRSYEGQTCFEEILQRLSGPDM